VHRVAFFDDLAPRWDEISRTGDSRMLEVLGQVLFDPQARILDLGCGTGRTVRHFLGRLGSAGRVTAVDFSLRMLEILRGSVRDPRLTCVQADVGNLPESLEGFDLVILFDLLPHLERPREILIDLSRRLLPGGQMVLAHDVGREELNRVHCEQGGAVRADRLPGDDLLVAWIQDAGLEVEDLQATPSTYLLRGRKSPRPLR